MKEQHSFLIYNRENGNFFIAMGEGDRYATCVVDIKSKFPREKFFVCCEEVTMKEYKDIQNAWLTPDGNFIPVGFSKHEEYAWEFLYATEKDENFYLKMKGYAYEELGRRGWMRIFNWTGKPLCVGHNLEQRPTYEQEVTLQYFCSIRGYNYEELFH